jgi:hypothetical protein
LLIAMLAHLGHNLAASLIPAAGDGGRQHLVNALAYLLTAVAVVVMTQPQTLRRRKRLNMSARPTSNP